MTLITPQNFSIPAGYSDIITFDVNPEVTDTMAGLTVWWRVYEQVLGVPIASLPAIIEKGTDASPPNIIAIDSPLSFTVELLSADTVNLLRNYIHEATIFNEDGEVIGGSSGIMTVTATENR